MLLFIVYFLSFILNVTIAENIHVLALYGNDQSKIIVKDTITRETLKTFTIQVEVTSGITIAYKKDLIFFSDEDGTVYRLHLVDEKGKRAKSGKGKLFTDKDAEHFERIFYNSGYPIIDLSYDEEEKKLFIITPAYIIAFDPEAEPDDVKKVSFISEYIAPSAFNIQHAVMTNSMVYLADSTSIYRAVTNALGYAPRFRLYAKLQSMTAFGVDHVKKRLYFFSQNTLNEINLKKEQLEGDFYHKNQSKVILADGGLTKAAHSMAALNGTIVWSSCAWKKLFLANVDKKDRFIPRSRVHVLSKLKLDEDSVDDACFHNINLFNHDFDLL